MLTWLEIAIPAAIILYVVAKPLLNELERIRHAAELTAVELRALREDLRIRHDEAARAAFTEKYGTEPDHWKAWAAAQHLER